MSPAQPLNSIIDQAKGILSPDLLLVILGPTASGKTRLAVELAEQVGGEIISADSRQVYRHMDIGTGKDLAEYGNIPYHLIDICEPGERYQADRFRKDFFAAYDDITKRGKRPILCGGTGSYIQTVFQDRPYAQIPKNPAVQEELAHFSKEELLQSIENSVVPEDLHIDTHSHKRLVRALEILHYLQEHPQEALQVLKPQRTVGNYMAFGLNPPLVQRRQRITQRLQERLNSGLLEEVTSLLQAGLSPDTLLYYGLEYKYALLHLQGNLPYDAFFEKLNTDIHRYAKRQMTYFRKMEKDGITIHWL